MFIVLLSLLFVLLPVCSALFEGDMKVSFNDVYAAYGSDTAARLSGDDFYKVHGSDPSLTKWPEGTVPFTFSPSSTFTAAERTLIAKTLKSLSVEVNGHVTFRSAMSSDRNYVEFVNGGSGCWSYLGMIGGKQPISLGRGCVTGGTITHEMLHALGFWHEQSRPDRNDHITVHTENIDPVGLSQFNVRKSIDSLGTPYDLKSIMHYHSFAFSKNRKRTMTSKKSPDMLLGGEVLTSIDKAQVKLMYGGTSGPTPPPTRSPTNAPSEQPINIIKPPPPTCRKIRHRRQCRRSSHCRWRRKRCIGKNII